jgi:hypothetical protein
MIFILIGILFACLLGCRLEERGCPSESLNGRRASGCYELFFDGMGRQPGAAPVACGTLIILIMPINRWQWNGQNYYFHGESSGGTARFQ